MFGEIGNGKDDEDEEDDDSNDDAGDGSARELGVNAIDRCHSEVGGFG